MSSPIKMALESSDSLRAVPNHHLLKVPIYTDRVCTPAAYYVSAFGIIRAGIRAFS